MCSACKAGTAAIPAQVLRTTPPRISTKLLERTRLSLNSEQFRTNAVTLVQAPQGFGKTSLLAQWRREHNARGAAVAWVSASGDDDPERLVQCLLLAVRTSCRRPEFCSQLVDSVVSNRGQEGITTWLAEVAQMPLDLVLIVDEAERYPAETKAALIYLMHNVPPNLRILVGCRSGFADSVADITAYGECVSVNTEDLHFRLDETMSLMRSRFPGQMDVDACARLHDLTEGWPLGLQIALSSLDRTANAHATIDSILARMTVGPENPIDCLLTKLSAKDLYFLTCVSVVDLLHPDLARSLTNREDAAECLARLVDDMPIFVRTDQKDWYRLHNLARAALRQRLAEFSTDEQIALHGRAMHWLNDRGILQNAAHHAFRAGQKDIAYRLLERSLYEAVMQGQWTIALDWLDILPQEVLDRLPRIRLAAALALALTNESPKAERIVGRILEQPDISQSLRYECALILTLAAYAADDPDLFVKVLEPWVESPPMHDTRLLQSHANRLGILAMLAGEPALARHHQEAVPSAAFGKAPTYSLGTGRVVSGLSYLAEGQVRLAEELVGPAAANADAEFGRHHPFACMLATILASAMYEQDKLSEASAVLANRLDVLKRVGMAESVLSGYCTAAMIAAAEGLEHRALDLLEVLNSIGVARRLPRLSIVALATQMRLHAGRFRKETCSALMQRIDDILARDDIPNGPLWRRSVEIHVTMARAYQAIAVQQWKSVLDHLDRSAGLAKLMKLGRVQVEAMGLRALALERSGGHGRAQLEEAMTLGHAYGLKRILIDAHPALGEWARHVADKEASPGQQDQVSTLPNPTQPRELRASPCSVLTPKERQVLELLARNLSTKKIAAAMDVRDSTAKWHIKNLFGKLDAGTRQHVVRRAQLLGLLQGAD